MGKKAFLFYITLFLIILAYSLMATNFDFDLWARLIAGMGVIDGGHVLKADFLSYTPVHTWWDHEWGSGVIFYLFLKFLGPFSLIILQAALFFFIIFTASKVIKIKSEFYPYNILPYLFTVIVLMSNLNSPVRCHMFSFLLFTVFIYILELVRTRGKNKLLYLIPILTIFWNNVHGGVVSGLGLIAMYAVGEFLNQKPFKKYIITLLLSSLALFINPWGYDYIKFLLMANTMQRPYITEWWGLFSQYFMHSKTGFKLFMLSAVLIEYITIMKDAKLNGLKKWYQNADKVKYIVLLTTMYLGITHVKLLPFFAISALCFVYDDLYKLIEKLSLPVWKDKVIYTLLILLSLLSFLTKDFSLPAGFNVYPVKEIEFVKINNLKGNILTNFGSGSYAAYKLYPHNLIYMDGRYEEVYYDYMIPLLKEFCLVYPNWKLILDNFPPDVIIIEKSYPVTKVLQSSYNWKMVYEGELFGVYIPAQKADRKFLQPSNDIQHYKNTLFDTDIKF